jgi:hypothetical protein
LLEHCILSFAGAKVQQKKQSAKLLANYFTVFKNFPLFSFFISYISPLTSYFCNGIEPSVHPLSRLGNAQASLALLSL